MKGKGFYIALCMCIFAIGIAGIAAYNQTVKNLNREPIFSPSDTSEADDVNQYQQDIPLDTQSRDDQQISDDNLILDAMQSNAAKIMPVTGEILTVYSNGELVKSETLNVWKTHDGIDIKGEMGTQVRAMTKGVVTDIYEDALWGVCVEVEHLDNVVGYYCNLAPDLSVTVGDNVNPGSIIGKIGETADIEAGMKPHLHFGLKQNGKWIDPLYYISPGK